MGVSDRDEVPATAATPRTTTTPRTNDTRSRHTRRIPDSKGQLSTALRTRGFGVISLSQEQSLIVQRAGHVAASSLTGATGGIKRVARANGASKAILNVAPGAENLPALAAMLRGLAVGLLEEMETELGLVGSRLLELAVSPPPDAPEKDASFLSAMSYTPAPTAVTTAGAADGTTAGGGEEHEDRGLLTLITGASDAALEVWDRVERAWVTPKCDERWVVVLVGAPLLVGALRSPARSRGPAGLQRFEDLKN